MGDLRGPLKKFPNVKAVYQYDLTELLIAGFLTLVQFFLVNNSVKLQHQTVKKKVLMRSLEFAHVLLTSWTQVNMLYCSSFPELG